MAEQFLLRFNSEQDLIAAREHLLEFELSDSAAFANGNPRLFHTTLSDSNALMCQCRATCRVKEDAVILDTNGSQVPFAKVFHQHSTRKSGKHHPDGMLWIRHPNRQHKVHS